MTNCFTNNYPAVEPYQFFEPDEEEEEMEEEDPDFYYDFYYEEGEAYDDKVVSATTPGKWK